MNTFIAPAAYRGWGIPNDPSSGKTSIFDILIEVIARLFKFLNPRDLEMTAEVCRTFRQILGGGFSWHIKHKVMAHQEWFYLGLTLIQKITRISIKQVQLFRFIPTTSEKYGLNEFVRKRTLYHIKKSLYQSIRKFLGSEKLLLDQLNDNSAETEALSSTAQQETEQTDYKKHRQSACEEAKSFVDIINQFDLQCEAWKIIIQNISRQGQFEDALSLFDKYEMSGCMQEAEAFRALFYAYLLQEDVDTTIETLEEISELAIEQLQHPKYGPLLISQIRESNQASEQFSQLAHLMTKAEARDADTCVRLFCLAARLAQLGRTTDAKPFFDRAHNISTEIDLEPVNKSLAAWHQAEYFLQHCQFPKVFEALQGFNSEATRLQDGYSAEGLLDTLIHLPSSLQKQATCVSADQNPPTGDQKWRALEVANLEISKEVHMPYLYFV